MQNQTSELLETIGNYEIGQLEGMKDSLSDFFSEWVNSLEENGIHKEHQNYTFHFTSMKGILNKIIHHKTSEKQ